MTLLHRHIAVVLLLAVFSLTTHAAVYHGPDTMDDHAQEQGHGHADSDTCIAGLTHAQLSFGQVVPTVTLVPIAMVPILMDDNTVQDVASVNPGRAPPSVNTSVTA